MFKGGLLKCRLALANASNIFDLFGSNNIDILILTKTWLHPAANARLDELIPPGYSILRQDRKQGRGGGVGIIHISNLDISVIDLHLQLPSLEFLTLYRQMNRNKSTVLVVVYHPPKLTQAFQDNLALQANTLSINYNSAFILGDMNAWAVNVQDTNLLDQLNHLESMGFMQLVQVPTHTAGHCLDWLLNFNFLNQGSKHQPVILEQPLLDIFHVSFQGEKKKTLHSSG